MKLEKKKIEEIVRKTIKIGVLLFIMWLSLTIDTYKDGTEEREAHNPYSPSKYLSRSWEEVWQERNEILHQTFLATGLFGIVLMIMFGHEIDKWKW
jgi:hypothetical protein